MPSLNNRQNKILFWINNEYKYLWRYLSNSPISFQSIDSWHLGLFPKVSHPTFQRGGTPSKVPATMRVRMRNGWCSNAIIIQRFIHSISTINIPWIRMNKFWSMLKIRAIIIIINFNQLLFVPNRHFFYAYLEWLIWKSYKWNLCKMFQFLQCSRNKYFYIWPLITEVWNDHYFLIRVEFWNVEDNKLIINIFLNCWSSYFQT